MDEAMTLTRAAQVAEVLAAGGHVEQRDRLVALVDANGNEVPAWQTAIKTAASRAGELP